MKIFQLKRVEEKHVLCVYIHIKFVCVCVVRDAVCVYNTNSVCGVCLSYEHSALLSSSISVIFTAAVCVLFSGQTQLSTPNSIKIIAKIKTKKNIYTTSTSSTLMSKYTYQYACERLLIQFLFVLFCSIEV